MAVLYETEGHVRIITIDRPEARNAVNMETRAELESAWSSFKDDDEAWVAILTGAGAQAFSAGADLKELNPAERASESGIRPAFGYITRDFYTDKPMIAALNGLAFGGGLEMALACDLRIAADHAQLGLTEARWALLPGGGGTQRLPRSVPRAVALEMLMTGQPISAQRAYEIGLVNRVTTSEQLMPIALELAQLICGNGPLAVRAAKCAVDQGADIALEDALLLEQRFSTALFATEDATEGPRAFKEKRLPDFRAK